MLNRKIHFSLLGSLFFQSLVWAGPVSLDAAQVEPLRRLVATDPEATAQFNSLRKTADAALKATPQPIPVLISEGKLASDPDKKKTLIALKDMPKAYSLAWAWLIDKNDQYSEKGIEFIKAWAQTNRPDGDPINETNLERLIVAYDILRPQFTPEDQTAIDNWLRDRAIKLWNDPRVHTGNWQSHRLKIVGMIATVVNDEALWNNVVEGFKQQIDVSFLPDGESIDFKSRDSMHYHLYSVQPLLALACVAQQRDLDWYNYRAPDGASLRQTVDFIKPFTDGEKTHMEFAHSSAKFDQTRANAGQKEYMPHEWESCQAGPTFATASCVDPSMADLAVKTWCGNGKSSHEHYVNWESVVNAVRRGPG
ncbi:MAG: alginate lyase family protein [Azoarcus sp.]|jgi:hypothetical protein|nr:alginate lyase family protein [Azoarcus sp.]